MLGKRRAVHITSYAQGEGLHVDRAYSYKTLAPIYGGEGGVRG
jgi:hypothetical protein